MKSSEVRDYARVNLCDLHQQTPDTFQGLVLDVGTILKLIGNPNELRLGFQPLGLFNHGTYIATGRVYNRTRPSSRSLTNVSLLASSVLDPAPSGLLCHNLRRLSGVRLSQTSGTKIINDGGYRPGTAC